MFSAIFLAFSLASDPLQSTSPVIDAGDVRVGPVLVHRFQFTNTAAETLTITDVRSSCGCMAPKLAQREYKPGEHGEMTVEVNTLSQPVGPHRWSFSLTYRCGEKTGEKTFELAARLQQEIEIAPAAIAFRGTDPPASIVTIADRRPKPLHVLSVEASSPRLRATIVPTGVQVCVAADCPPGQVAETVTIKTDDADYREIKLPVTIDREAKQAVTALPNRATIVAGGSVVVQLRAANGEPVQVEAIEGSVPALSCRWAAGPNDRTTLRIGLDRSKWDGSPFTGEVRVRLKTPAGESVVIPVSVRPEE